MLRHLARLNWWQTLLLIALLFAAFAACLAWWLASRGDLEESDARARGLGLPLSVAELALAPGDPARSADWTRLIALGEQLKPWGDGEAAKGWTYGPGIAVPEAVAAHHATLDQAAIAEAAAILGRLGDAPVNSLRELSPTTRTPDVPAMRRLLRLWCERIALAPPERVGAECLTASALLPPREPVGLLRLMATSVMAEQWSAAVMARAGDLGAEREALAARASAIAGSLPVLLRTAYRTDLAVMREFLGDADPAAVWGRLGNAGGTWSLSAWGFAVAVRAGRAKALGLMQDVCAAQDEPTAARRHLDAARTAEAAAGQATLWRPGSLLPTMLLPLATPVIANAHGSRLRLLSVAAELGGGAWPVDAMDPASGPLRRVEREGRLVGAYSLGADGQDAGGDLKLDRCWPLHGPLGSPRAGDPPQAAAPAGSAMESAPAPR